MILLLYLEIMLHVNYLCSTAIDSDELMPPMKDEIKNDQWMGVTVRSQGSGGKVIVSFNSSVLIFIKYL